MDDSRFQPPPRWKSLADAPFPIAQCEEPNELVTPTGAALLAEFAESFCAAAGLCARENRLRHWGARK